MKYLTLILLFPIFAMAQENETIDSLQKQLITDISDLQDLIKVNQIGNDKAHLDILQQLKKDSSCCSNQDTFHLVTVFNNGWKTDPNNPLRYKRDFLGNVYIQGQVSLNGLASGGLHVFTLPHLYKPVKYPVSEISRDFVSGNIWPVIIVTDGRVFIDAGTNPNLVLNFSFQR